jgi:hypothetical protein
VSEEANNIIRKRITDGTYAKFANKKGDALYETSTTKSYSGKYTSGTISQTWLIDTLRASTAGGQYSTSWNSDYMLIGYASLPWFMRGGYYGYGTGSGVFFAHLGTGCLSVYYGFRPVLTAGLSL